MKVFYCGLIFISLLACSTASYNPTTFDYYGNIKEQPDIAIKTVLVPDFNYGVPSRHYLQKHEQQIDNQVTAYLKTNKVNVISNRPFHSYWKRAEQKYGDTFNPTTGKRTNAFELVLKEAMQQTFANNPTLDAIIFTDIVEIPVATDGTNKRAVQWMGVTRKIKVEGLGNGVSDGFDWNQELDGISLSVTILDKSGEVLMHNIAGIQIAQALHMNNKSAKFKRRSDILANESHIEEAIQIALHPIIYFKGYPGKK